MPEAGVGGGGGGGEPQCVDPKGRCNRCFLIFRLSLSGLVSQALKLHLVVDAFS